MTIQPLDAGNLAWAALALLLGSALSLVLALQIHRSLLWAALRLLVQLVLVGLVLRLVFEVASLWATAGVVVLQLVAATFEVGARQDRRLAGFWHYGLGALSVTSATLLVTALALSAALPDAAWDDPRHLIPLVGIILGSTMNAASLALNTLFTGVVRERNAIEARLALGADRYTALRGSLRQALRTSLIPAINQMAGAGIITMPGIMTGQILAGLDPLEAAKYQILLMLLLAGASCLGAQLALALALHKLTDDRHRLRLDRLRAS